jgi:hypothetical protein
VLTVVSLLKKYKKAVRGLADTTAAHEGLTQSLPSELVKKWGEAEQKAMMDRGDALRIFDVVEKKGQFFHPQCSKN